jgi:hypothetical protein
MLGFVKRVYEVLPKEVTRVLRVIPDSYVFGSSYRHASPSFDAASIPDAMADILSYARDHTVFLVVQDSRSG